MPCRIASASTNALKVEPPWKPLEPPMARLTLLWPGSAFSL